MIFILLYFFGFFLVYYSHVRFEKLKTIFIVIYSLVIIIIFSVRVYDFGMIDIVTYLNIFTSKSDLDVGDTGLSYFYAIIKLFGSSYYVFSLSVAIVITVPLAFIFYKIDPKSSLLSLVFFSSLTFFFIFEVNTFRSAFSGLTFLSGFLLMNKGRRLSLYIVSFLLHKSVLAYLILSFFSHIKIKKIFFLLIPTVAIIALLFGFNGTEVFLTIISKIPLLEKKAAVGLELMKTGQFGMASLNHKNVLVIISCYLVYFNYQLISISAFYRLRKIVNFNLLCLTVSIIFSANQLLYDRFLMIPNVLSVAIICFVASQKLGKSTLFIFFGFVVTVSGFVTVFLWMPRNVIRSYDVFIW